MVLDNEDRNGTAFAITCDAIAGTTTGASSADRALTVRLMADGSAKAAAFNRPGHILPLVARAGGVLERGGHTEASVDMCVLAGCEPVGLICELMHPNGRMMRR
jgi:3,4-dihydroxy 2-butanone 4-phosphate synthase/GTP cyclohydrolase II